MDSRDYIDWPYALPHLAPSEAELAIDPQFYAFLSGLTAVLVIVALSFTLAHCALTTIRTTQYRAWRSKRRRDQDKLTRVTAAGTVTGPSDDRPKFVLVPPPPRLTKSFVPTPPEPPLISTLTSMQSALFPSSPQFLSKSVAALFTPTAKLNGKRVKFASPNNLITTLTEQSKKFVSLMTPLKTPRRLICDSDKTVPLTSQLAPSAKAVRSAIMETPRPVTKPPSETAAPLHLPLPLPPPSPPQSRPVLTSEQLDAIVDEQHEHNRGFLSYSLSTFLVTIALLWLILFPLTLIVTTRSYHYALFAWCSEELVDACWTVIVSLSSFSLFILAPFAYLYYEAEGLVFFSSSSHNDSRSVSEWDDSEDSSNGTLKFLPRFVETIIVLLCVSSMLYGCFYFIYYIFLSSPPSSVAVIGPDNNPHAHQSLLMLAMPTFLSELTHSLTGAYEWLLSLASNITHVVPGLLLCLFQSHTGFYALLSQSFHLRVPFFYHQYLTRRLGETEVKLQHAQYSLTRSLSARDRAQTIEAIIVYEEEIARINTEIQPRQRCRFLSSPLIRNAVWFVLTGLCLLLIWHILIRVIQREVRLLVLSLELALQRTIDEIDAVSAEQRSVGVSLMLMGVSTLKWLLRLMKHGVNDTLTAIGMIRRSPTHTGTVVNSDHLLPSISPQSHSQSQSLSLWLRSFVVQCWSDSLRLLSSLLLGQNGFQHPITIFVFDMAVATFFCVCCLVGLYRASFMRQFSPFDTSSAHTSTIGDIDSQNAFVLAANPTVSAVSPTVPLLTAQSYVVNSAILLLLSSSFPFAVWMLGLSSFDLPHYYPPIESLSQGLFIHLYNLLFLAIAAQRGAELWCRILWTLALVCYTQCYRTLVWVAPTMESKLKHPDRVSELPQVFRSMPVIRRAEFLVSVEGLKWLLRASLAPVVRLSWLIALYLIRVLAIALRLCTRTMYERLVKAIQQEISATKPALPHIVRAVSGNEQSTSDDAVNLARVRGSSKMRWLDDEKGRDSVSDADTDFLPSNGHSSRKLSGDESKTESSPTWLTGTATPPRGTTAARTATMSLSRSASAMVDALHHEAALSTPTRSRSQSPLVPRLSPESLPGQVNLAAPSSILTHRIPRSASNLEARYSPAAPRTARAAEFSVALTSMSFTTSASTASSADLAPPRPLPHRTLTDDQ